MHYWQRMRWAEGLVLLFAFPFLLFPERFIILAAIILVLLVLLWTAPLFIIRKPLIQATPFNTALLVFCITVCIAILVTADPHLTLPKATGLILGLAIWRYLIIAVQARDQVKPAIAAYLLLGSGFIVAGLLNANWLPKSTSQVPVLGQIMSDIPVTTNIAQDNAGTHPNQIAGTIMLILPLLLAILGCSTYGNNGERTLNRIVLGAFTILLSFALILTQSRSGWFGIIGGLLAILVMGSLVAPPSAKRRIFRSITILLFFLMLLGLLVIGPGRIQQLWLEPPQETILGSFSTLNYRQDLWPWAMQAIGDFPFTGMGLGTFREAGRRLYPIPIPVQYDFAHAHNAFLQVTLDLGIPGLIAYSALILLGIVLAWQIAVNDVKFRAYAAGLLASLIAFHIYGLADTMALGSKSSVLLWANLGLLAAMMRLR